MRVLGKALKRDRRFVVPNSLHCNETSERVIRDIIRTLENVLLEGTRDSCLGGFGAFRVMDNGHHFPRELCEV